MRVYDQKDTEGRIFAFEVDNLNLGRRDLCELVARIPGAAVVREPKWLSWFREEEFCEFVVDGQRFTAWEPFGDNSRYWIGPDPPVSCAQMAAVRETFVRHKPSLVPFHRLFRAWKPTIAAIRRSTRSSRGHVTWDSEQTEVVESTEKGGDDETQRHRDTEDAQ
jgi:hypothetical protein